MNDENRGAIADLAVVGVASMALYFVATRPALRRTMLHALTYGVFTAAPNLVWREVTRAWADSAHN